jgi:putative addiction module component (TIGR02574 family)
MKPGLLDEVLSLPPDERIEILDAVWETLSPEDLPVTSDELALLDARMADLESRPQDQSSWSEVKARLENRRRR